MNCPGESSISCMSSRDFRMMVVRLPQEKMAAKKPAISMSCFLLNRCGMLMGSLAIKDGRLYSSTFLSRNLRRSFAVSLDMFQTLAEVVDEIVCVLDADAETDQGI